MPFPGPSKRQKFHYPPEFWDGLSKIWLEPDALWELNRRNRSAPKSQPAESKKQRLQYALIVRLLSWMRSRALQNRGDLI